MKNTELKKPYDLGVLDFSILINHLIKQFDGMCKMHYDLAKNIVSECPMLNGPIDDLSQLEHETCKQQMIVLTYLLFPAIYWERNKIALLKPASMTVIKASPCFHESILDDEGHITRSESFDQEVFFKKRLSRMYMHILEQMYNIDTSATSNDHMIHPCTDKQTGLERFYLFDIDMRFVKVTSHKPLPELDEETIKTVKRNITEPERIQPIIPIDQFEISGVTIVKATDITQQHVLSLLQKDLIDRDNITTQTGFNRIQQRLRNYFKLPSLGISVACFYGNHALLINTGCDLSNSCMFTNSRQMPLSFFKDTPFEEAVKNQEVYVFSDIQKHNFVKISKKAMNGENIRSLMICPLIYRDECIGTLDLASPEPNTFGTQEMLKVEDLRPLFAMAINRATEDLDNEIQGIIKEKCTAVHPSVEWRFRQATLNYITEMQNNVHAELAPIIFKNVYPLYGIADVRGSTNARNNAIQKDLANHLRYARNVVEQAAKEKNMLIFDQLLDRIEDEMARIQKGLASGDELSVVRFIQSDIEDVFSHIRHLCPDIKQAIEEYESKIDKELGTVYHLRKEFEESILLLNQRLANFLDSEQVEVQKVFPHFYERHRTDGVDYLIYIGKSMNESGHFHELYVKNLHLWQLRIACGMAWITQHLKPELSVNLDIAHLILVQNSPLSIRFRYDEKQFDVDGAYDIRHEIIKSRIDKAVVKGTKERLTQPQKIAIVYSLAEEEIEMMQHITYLQKHEFLKKNVEFLDLEDLPGVNGLKALRVGVILNSAPLSKWMENFWHVN